jgi:hypothetical protein
MTPEYLREQEEREKIEKLAKFYGAEALANEGPVKRLLSDILHLQEMLQEAEEGNVPIYCPECESCGEEGCCSPNNCVAVRCLYKNSNLKSYWECRDENEILWKFLEEAKERPQTPEDAHRVRKEIEAVWDKTLEEHQKQNTDDNSKSANS